MGNISRYGRGHLRLPLLPVPSHRLLRRFLTSIGRDQLARNLARASAGP